VPTYIISDVNTLPSFALNHASARSNVKKNLTSCLGKGNICTLLSKSICSVLAYGWLSFEDRLKFNLDVENGTFK
jgi:hypothetical protein